MSALSLVLKDIPNNVLVYGNPAKIIRNRGRNEILFYNYSIAVD